MNALSLSDAMLSACKAIGIEPPRKQARPGRWVRTDTLGKNGKGDAAVLIFDDERGGIAWNHQTAQNLRFSIGGDQVGRVDPKAEARRRERKAREEAECRQVEGIASAIVRASKEAPHPYLVSKGFSNERGLVCENPRYHFPAGRFGEMLAMALPESDEPFLIVPGRVGSTIKTVQFITADGRKKNILRGMMSGAAHRIATGRDTWVCEGIATAYSVRAALRLLGVSATILSAFSASNVALVAKGIPGARIAADNDKAIEALDGLGTGEFYARRSGCRWTMPPALGDYNDMHMSAGLRAVALHLREAMG